MFGIGFIELLVIFVILLLVVGPEKLPELAKTIGKVMGELKKTTDDLKKSIHDEAKEDPLWKHDTHGAGEADEVSGDEDSPSKREQGS